MLTDHEILEFIKARRLIIDPFDETKLRSGKCEVQLGRYVLIPEKTERIIDPADETGEPPYRKIDIKENPYVMTPGTFILAQTDEKIGLDGDFSMYIDGRSTLARLGLSIHQTSTYIPPGQDPHIITLELFNAGIWSIRLSYKMHIGHLNIFKFSSKNTVEARHYNQYNGQSEVTGAIFDET